MPSCVFPLPVLGYFTSRWTSTLELKKAPKTRHHAVLIIIDSQRIHRMCDDTDVISIYISPLWLSGIYPIHCPKAGLQQEADHRLKWCHCIRASILAGQVRQSAAWTGMASAEWIEGSVYANLQSDLACGGASTLAISYLNWKSVGHCFYLVPQFGLSTDPFGGFHANLASSCLIENLLLRGAGWEYAILSFSVAYCQCLPFIDTIQVLRRIKTTWNPGAKTKIQEPSHLWQPVQI